MNLSPLKKVIPVRVLLTSSLNFISFILFLVLDVVDECLNNDNDEGVKVADQHPNINNLKKSVKKSSWLLAFSKYIYFPLIVKTPGPIHF